MIVKDEAASIARTIRSALPHIDAAIILDTGSTDDTPRIARDVLAAADVPYEIHREPFIDFAATRNRVLDLLAGRCCFALTLDADETIEAGPDLRAWLDARRNEPAGAYDVTIQFGAASYAHPRLLRSEGGWRWKGRVHEAPCGPGDTGGRAPAVVHHDTEARHRDAAKYKRRWREVDLPLLADEMIADPSNPRPAFYYAQTLAWLGEWYMAEAAYDRRIAMGGWWEEVYHSLMGKAACMAARNLPWDAIRPVYERACEVAPHRAEPMVCLARHYQQSGQPVLGYPYALAACALPEPAADRLTVDLPAWNSARWDLLGICAWYVGDFARGEDAVRRALAVADLPHLRENLAHYTAR